MTNGNSNSKEPRSRLWPVEAEALLALALAAGGLLAFVAVAGIVFNGGLRSFDEGLILALRTPGATDDPLGPVWFEELVRDLTALGSTGVLTLIVLATAGFLTLTGRGRTGLAILIWSGAGTALSQVAKSLFARPRPDLVAHAAEVYTLSFPSGHSMLSAVIYLTIGALVAGTQDDRAVKTYVMGLAVLLTVLVGASRVYLGVHWPTDVLAGWALGAGWACLGWACFDWAGFRTASRR